MAWNGHRSGPRRTRNLDRVHGRADHLGRPTSRQRLGGPRRHRDGRGTAAAGRGGEVRRSRSRSHGGARRRPRFDRPSGAPQRRMRTDEWSTSGRSHRPPVLGSVVSVGRGRAGAGGVGRSPGGQLPQRSREPLDDGHGRIAPHSLGECVPHGQRRRGHPRHRDRDRHYRGAPRRRRAGRDRGRRAPPCGAGPGSLCARRRVGRARDADGLPVSIAVPGRRGRPSPGCPAWLQSGAGAVGSRPGCHRARLPERHRGARARRRRRPRLRSR